MYKVIRKWVKERPGKLEMRGNMDDLEVWEEVMKMIWKHHGKWSTVRKANKKEKAKEKAINV